MSVKAYTFRTLVVVLAAMIPLNGCLQEERTCLVLSVGGTKGFAHAGAIDALTELGIDIHSVYGNSMGAVVGSLYSYQPNVSPRTSVQNIFRQYQDSTEMEIADRAVGGFLVGAALALLSGGALGWETMLGATAIGGFSVEKFDNRRFMAVLDSHFNYAVMETLPIPFATSYQSKVGDSLDFVIAGSGNLAQAVARSANNPFVFSGTSMRHLDPGSDRLAMTPVEDAYAHFSPSRIIAINVTGVRSHYTRMEDCDVIEILVKVPEAESAASGDLPSVINELYEYGYMAVMKEFGK